MKTKQRKEKDFKKKYSSASVTPEVTCGVSILDELSFMYALAGVNLRNVTSATKYSVYEKLSWRNLKQLVGAS